MSTFILQKYSWTKEVFRIEKPKNIIPWTYIIEDVNENIV